ncbi:MAG: circularly permuted type 2 ATP-grasp protein [Proteobacteria bacterium]|nr:circularly permuted type 2 ATP-grasp protein [Pseudomonadota bacterium]
MLKDLLAGYSALEGRYDELLARADQPRPHWAAFLRALADRPGQDVADTLSLTERQIREHGITYNVYADPKGADRPWEVDPLPLLLSAGEWRAIEAGIAQRADLLNRVLADLYGDQTLLRSGAIPPPVVYGHSGFLHPLLGARPPVHLMLYAADLARSPDGHWWVVSDRTQAPSGAGYALENRLVVSRVFPQLFRDLRVEHLASFFGALRESALRWAPRGGPGDGTPLIVLLTPGPYNETYFEHALLARYLGFALVEGNDLTVRNGCVWMKTVDGLKRVHGILRRQDDDYCDPLELRSDSALGIAGLTDCARRGTVLIGNALGSGVLESGALLGYLPALSERLLGEPLQLPSVATWWLGEPAAFDDAWKRIDKLIIKPLERSVREHAVFGADLSADERTVLRARVASRPQRYVAQEWVHVSQAPVLEPGTQAMLAARTVGLRVFAVATPGGYRVMPGGLTRVAGDEESRVIAMQRGGRSKDTWVLSDAPVNASFSLISTTVGPDDLATSRGSLPSRAAENLHWFGRYGERCDNTARLLRVAIAGVLEADALNVDNHAPAWVLAQRLGVVESLDDPAVDLLRAATHPDEALADRLRLLSRVAFTLRDRMSADHWRTLNQLTSDPVFRHGAGLPLALAWLDRAVTAMVTLSGYVLDGMTRSVGWRFLSIGRRVERLAHLSTTLQVAIEEGRSHGLDWLLELCDSSGTYRSRYMVAPEWLPVLDLLVRDEANPRSIAFQLKGLSEYIAKLEASHGRFASDVISPALASLKALAPIDLDPESRALGDLLEQTRRTAASVSDELTLKFFSHAMSRSVLSLVA